MLYAVAAVSGVGGLMNCCTMEQLRHVAALEQLRHVQPGDSEPWQETVPVMSRFESNLGSL